MIEWTNTKLCDVVNLLLGIFLAASPWIFNFGGPASTNALVGGVVIALLSIAALSVFAQWEEWINLLLGLWVLVSPWVLAFTDATAIRVHVAVGIVVAVLAAIELIQQMPSRTASH